jgi:hypothetical protein
MLFTLYGGAGETPKYSSYISEIVYDSWIKFTAELGILLDLHETKVNNYVVLFNFTRL